MVPILILIAFICRLSSAAEINIPKLREVLNHVGVKEAEVASSIASHFYKMNKSNWKDTALILPSNFATISKEFWKVSNEISIIIDVLKAFEKADVSGNVEIPNQLFNKIEDGFTSLAVEFKTLVIKNNDYYEKIANNSNEFHQTPQGEFWLPLKLGQDIVKTIEEIKAIFSSMQSSCKNIQKLLIQASKFLVGKAGSNLFKNAAVRFQKAAIDFANISHIIGRNMLQYKSLGTINDKNQVIFPFKQFIEDYNGAFYKIGQQFSDLEGQIDPIAPYDDADNSSS